MVKIDVAHETTDRHDAIPGRIHVIVGVGVWQHAHLRRWTNTIYFSPKHCILHAWPRSFSNCIIGQHDDAIRVCLR
jgi:hypothetical protein